jgi:hypothetical protein
MQQIALNVIAVGIFAIAIFSMLGPLVHISPLVPTLLTLGLLGLLSLDTLLWRNRGISMILEVLAGKEYRQRVIHHEAGHMLIAYLLGIPVLDYSLSTREAWRKGQSGSGGVVLDIEKLQAIEDLPPNLEKLCTVWMGGIAAEQIIYTQAEGGQEDRQQLYATLQQRGLKPNVFPTKERFAILEAKKLLTKHNQAYQTLVELMEKGTALEGCYQALNLLQKQSPEMVKN